jgi:hypothetical protein
VFLAERSQAVVEVDQPHPHARQRLGKGDRSTPNRCSMHWPTGEIERSESTVRARLRVSGRSDFVMEWPLDTRVTLAVISPHNDDRALP